MNEKLEGMYFHSIDGDEVVEWQGRVLYALDGGNFIVELFDWVTGAPSHCILVDVRDMLGWLFYKGPEDMRYSYEHGTASRNKQRSLTQA